MVKKFILVLLTVLFGIQIVSSHHECYSCQTPQTCADGPLDITKCDAENTRATTAFLNGVLLEVPAVTDGETVCLHLAINQTGSPNMEFKGCVYARINACDLKPKSTGTGSNWHWSYQMNCYTCSRDLCNPAGTFSYSGYTLLPSLIGVYLVKMLST